MVTRLDWARPAFFRSRTIKAAAAAEAAAVTTNLPLIERRASGIKLDLLSIVLPLSACHAMTVGIVRWALKKLG